VIGFLTERFGAKIRPGSAIGIKPMSKFGSSAWSRNPSSTRCAPVAARHARSQGNIMSHEAGPRVGYELAKELFGDKTITEDETGKGKGERES